MLNLSTLSASDRVRYEVQEDKCAAGRHLGHSKYGARLIPESREAIESAFERGVSVGFADNLKDDKDQVARRRLHGRDVGYRLKLSGETLTASTRLARPYNA